METSNIKEDCPYFVNGVCMEYLDGSCENHKCDLKIIDELNKKLFELEQECEELKKRVNELEECEDIFFQENQDFRKIYSCLQEIKEIAETCRNKNIDNCYECKYFDDCEIEDETVPTRDVCKLILTKVNEVLNDRDNTEI